MSLRTQSHRLACITSMLLLPAITLIGCGTPPPSSSTTPSPVADTSRTTKKPSAEIPALPPAGSGRGAYYMDDGPGEAPPEGLLDTPDPEPKVEPYSRTGNRPYVVFGKQYTPIADERPFKQRGIGSWYGKKFHGQRTSSGERYDMYKMTAAHPTLPIPSYARVTNLSNGKQVIVRVNDRGPFHSGRIIDLSYTAALKLGYLGKGSSELEVERLLPAEIERLANLRKEQQISPSAETRAIPVAESVPAASANATDTATPVVASAPPTAASSPGFYLQLGTFAQAGNAEAARARLTQNSALALPSVEVVEYGLFYRLYSGPFASRADAATAALRLQNDGAFKPMIVQR